MRILPSLGIFFSMFHIASLSQLHSIKHKYNNIEIRWKVLLTSEGTAALWVKKHAILNYFQFCFNYMACSQDISYIQSKGIHFSFWQPYGCTDVEKIPTGKSIMKSQRTRTEIMRCNYDTVAQSPSIFHHIAPYTNQQFIMQRKNYE